MVKFGSPGDFSKFIPKKGSFIVAKKMFFVIWNWSSAVFEKDGFIIGYNLWLAILGDISHCKFLRTIYSRTFLSQADGHVDETDIFWNLLLDDENQGFLATFCKDSLSLPSGKLWTITILMGKSYKFSMAVLVYWRASES